VKPNALLITKGGKVVRLTWQDWYGSIFASTEDISQTDDL